jgi:aspartyl-tRNA(Asn)/glutamyl-tRNA(Gln) amidotransferase subunit A
MKSWKSAISDGLDGYRDFVSGRDKDIGSFLSFSPDSDASGKAGSESPLTGLPFAVKDNIAVQGMPLTCGSKFLENFVSPYSATAVSRLTAAGAIPVGKTNLDEFGMGSSTDNSALKQTGNPWDTSRVAGGSSGGSAAAVAAGLVPFALGSDTGGSIRQPAAFCGVYGLKPSYGAVSRYGLVAYASSLETVGVLSADLGMCQSAFETIRGKDSRDDSSVDFRDFPIGKSEVRKIGVLTGELGLSEEVAEGYQQAIVALQKRGFELAEVDIPSLEYTVPAYYTIATAEASANLARFNGVRYGERPVYAENPEELVRKARDQGFGDEVKLRILLGTYVLRSGFQDRYYHKAQAIRAEIRREFRQVFEAVDSLMLPVYPVQAFLHGDAGLDPFQQKVADRFTTAANLTGLPGLSCPGPLVGGLPTGVQFMAPAFHEHLLFEAGEKLAESFPLQAPPAFPAEYGPG